MTCGKMHLIATDFRGGNWQFVGTHAEIEMWLAGHQGSEDISVVVADATGGTAGIKHIGERNIHWVKRDPAHL